MSEHQFSDDQPLNESKNLPVRSQPAPLAIPARRVSRTTVVPEKQEITSFGPAFLLWVFQQWWKITVPVGLVLAVATGAVILARHVDQFSASALIRIDHSAPFIAFSQGRVGGMGGGGSYIQTQIELLRSPIVLGPVLSRPELASMGEFQGQADPLGILQEKVTIRQVGKSQLYQVYSVSTSPKDAASIANAVVAEYLSIQSDEGFRRSQRVIDLLEEERNRRSLEVERLREHVVALAKEVTGKDPFAQGIVTDVGKAMGSVSGLFQNLTDIEVQQELLKAEMQALRDAPTLFPDQAESSGLLDLTVANQPQVLELQATRDAIHRRLEYLKEMMVRWETEPDYLRLQEDLDVNTKKLVELKGLLREQFKNQNADSRGEEQKLAIASMEWEMDKLEVKKKLLTRRFDKHMNELKEGGGKSVQLEFARSELMREEKVFEMIAARKLALQTELRAPTRVQLQQAAKIPTTPMVPIPYKLLLMGCTVAFVSPLALATLREFTVRRISDVEQLRKESQLHVLGEVSRFPIRPVATGTHLLSRSMRRDMYIYAESIDSLRTNLVLSNLLGSKSVLAVTSATSGEGKTSVSTSLASSIAAATNKPTVIIDADLRSPDVANVLGTPSKPGLSELLQSKCRLSEAIQRVGETNTYVLPAGLTKANPHHLVDSNLVEQLFDRLKQEFETIVVDTPPILGASESLIFAKAADTVVFCSLRDVSRARQVHLAVDRLEHAGAKVAGAVLSGMPVNHYAYSYGYYGNQKD
jgi:succinoglycan biosynthesis transport protein ExoP